MRTMDQEKDSIICDLDGTIALDIHRAHHLHPTHAPDCLAVEVSVHESCPSCGRKKRDWATYFSLCGSDEPNWAVIDVLRLLWEDGYRIHILSGRTASVQDVTEKWLREHAVPHHTLRMRDTDDRTDDHILKPRWAAELGLSPQVVRVVFEDRQRVVDAWRHLGYDVFQVAPGKF